MAWPCRLRMAEDAVGVAGAVEGVAGAVEGVAGAVEGVAGPAEARSVGCTWI